MAHQTPSATLQVFPTFDLLEHILLHLYGPKPFDHPTTLALKLKALLALRYVDKTFKVHIDNSFRLQRRIVVMDTFRLTNVKYGSEITFMTLLHVLKRYCAPLKQAYERVDYSTISRKPNGDVTLQASVPADAVHPDAAPGRQARALWRSVRLRCFGYCRRERLTMRVHGPVSRITDKARSSKHTVTGTGSTTLGEMYDLYDDGLKQVLPVQSVWVTLEDEMQDSAETDVLAGDDDGCEDL